MATALVALDGRKGSGVGGVIRFLDLLPLCGIPILPVSLMISGMSLVSSIVVDMSDSNCASYQWRHERRGHAASDQ